MKPVLTVIAAVLYLFISAMPNIVWAESPKKTYILKLNEKQLKDLNEQKKSSFHRLILLVFFALYKMCFHLLRHRPMR